MECTDLFCFDSFAQPVDSWRRWRPHLRSDVLAFAALALVGVSPALAAPGWNCEELASANPYAQYVNALYGQTPYAYTNNGAIVKPPSLANSLTDGAILLAQNGLPIYGNSSLMYKFGGDAITGITLKNVRVTSSWANANRCQIQIAALYVKTVAGGDEWIPLANSALQGLSTGKMNYQATYADSTGVPLAEGATDLWVDFGATQSPGYVGYTEIEAEMEVAGAVSVMLETPCPAGYGSISFSPASDDGAGSYAIDTEVTMTAIPAAGCTFHSWYGDVDAGHEFDNPLTVAMDDNRRITPVFSGDWQWANGQMRDGYWRVTTSVSGTEMAITLVESVIASPILDFRKGITGTDAAPTTVNENALYGRTATVRDLYFPDTLVAIGRSGCRGMTALTNCVLSANLASLDYCAFADCPNLVHVAPLLPNSLATLTPTAAAGQAFRGTPLSGRLVIANKRLAAVPDGTFQGTSGLNEADLSKSGVTALGAAAFRESGVTNIWLPKTVVSIGDNAFMSCNGLRSMYFESLPSCFGGNAFAGAPATMRIVIYRNDADWLAYMANDAASFTAWADLPANVRDTYAFADDCVPYGKVKIGAGGSTVFVATRRNASIPTFLLMH